ncbi:hypothetical protein A3A14_01235 [Candidatus Daviesbacteria bacterium RIFCSPLOWO2_01_FULL_43_38]|uniref:Cation-transporting P-type ATPase N-terminal domain-containing protein n=2 Tax=Candidatus Daviesiibacteriota TaxID=1752718 RepID=A0A1F5K2L0_9BACT|nr:MAG: hypothetical protein A2874_02920 [Candidatus Daviesbacteria bacterium RIFCSPHIGHO2_01_FULL_43_17]OGE35207.1 MAG: hypothetical protein A3E45_02900 [Candidatus Daviesbacteria bacterium RIFCSPHIGHO2_12_FULL_43_11]OGE63280.1 MAG: hypothetical protein A3A14_01235 [Candidatus Daviesbacteria bacterium RIFCSPLOWO2_01_FULL_43_38]OGE68944.1 MAG: hypothetical protein A3J21_02420 [Candidatus Daviesbacteria bacterium RIFCSPLOWO2_02_FULL_43_11]
MTVSATGLTASEATSLLKKYGPNEIEDLRHVSPLGIILRQARKNFILYLLILAAAISFFVGEAVTGYTVLVVAFLVVSIGFIQEYRAEKAIAALKKMIMPVSTVFRDGKEQEVQSKLLVPGDVIILRNGEKVPADCILLEENNLLVNESVLTGESKEVSKEVGKDQNDYSEKNMLFMGSFIVGGRCKAQVIHTGMNTKFGGIAGMIQTAEKQLPLQDKVNEIAKSMVMVAIIASLSTGALMVFRNFPLSPDALTEILILVIALSVSAFPEGLPVVLVTTLAVGANRMARKNAIVNRMSIIETLGETTVICADKTGTITRGEMTVKKVFLGGKMYDIGGVGYEAEGDILLGKETVNVKEDTALQLLLKSAVLCNDSRIEKTGEDAEYKIFGTPTEGSLLIFAAKVRIFQEDLKFSREEEMPFDSNRKMMSVLCKLDSKNYVFAKGAPEILLEKCQFIQRDGKVERLSEEDRKQLLKTNRQLTQDSFRTLALAYKEAGEKDTNYQEEELVFLGLVGIEDPPREEVKEAILTCFKAGIAVKMITGDHKETAQAVASEIGLLREGLPAGRQVLEGSDLDKMTDDELSKIIKEVVIFARVKPEHKLRLVKILKNLGEIVTMTGDGVNDAPALKEAHIGVAMGKNGTDVSRSVADLTLKDDNFATIVVAIREGRTIFNNIRKFVSYQLSCNYAELAILFFGVLLSPLLGWQVPLLLALQILFMNLVTDDLPALTLAFNRSSTDVMSEKPRKKASIISKKILVLTLSAAAVMAFLTLLTFFISFNIFNQSLEIARTTALVSLILLEIAGAFHFRSFRRQVLTRSPFVNPYLFYASGISVLATILIVYTSANLIFRTFPIDGLLWGMPVFAALLFILIFDLKKASASSYAL